jgi:hypothetical protein
MSQIVSQIIHILQQGVSAVFRFLQLIWTWSFGQIVAVFQSDWQSLPVWKIGVLIIVVAAIAYVLYRAALVLWAAVESLFRAFISLLLAFISVLPQIVVAGLIAFAGGWIIRTINF